jgi:mannose-6-phosphate isomerase-like protein (cupin superfamily)
VAERTPGSRTGADARARLEAEGLDPGSWSNGPGDRYGAHDHGYDKVLVVTSGSIVFGLPDRAERVALEVGDRLDLPAGTSHDARVGPIGVTCLEAHIAAGTLPAAPAKRPAGSW